MSHRPTSLVVRVIVACLCASSVAACTTSETKPSASSSDAGSLFVIRADDVEVRHVSAGVIEAEFDVESKVVSFADRPIRHAGSLKLSRLVQRWDQLGFKGDPPNGALEVDGGSAAGVAAVKVSAPRFSSENRAWFRLSRLKGEKVPAGLADVFGTSKSTPSRLGSASLFIDPSDSGQFFNYPEDRRYTKDGVWAKVENGVATIGLSDAFLDSFGKLVLVNVEVPQGEDVDVGDPVVSLESADGNGDLDSPVSGEVVETNSSIDGPSDDQDLTSQNDDPYESGWYLRIKLDDPSEVDKMLSAADYIASLPNSQKPNAAPIRPGNPPTPLHAPVTPGPTIDPANKYVIDFEVVSGTSRWVECDNVGQQERNGGSFEKIPYDLNAGAGGKFVYLCVEWASGDPRDIKNEGISWMSVSGPATNDSGRPVPGQVPRYCDPTDLNDGAAGDYLYLCGSGGVTGEGIIHDLEVVTSAQKPSADGICRRSWDLVKPASGGDTGNSSTVDTHGSVATVDSDLNQGSGGPWIYLCLRPWSILPVDPDNKIKPLKPAPDN
ncbi:MAG: hypothetical protein WAL70_09485 [Aeromicrobium sp.]